MWQRGALIARGHPEDQLHLALRDRLLLLSLIATEGAAGGFAMTNAKSEYSGKSSQIGALPMWGAVATVLGLASDLAQPIGSFALWIFGLFVFITVLALIIRSVIPALKKHAGNLAKYTFLGSIIFALVVGLQHYSEGDSGEGPQRGFLATTIEPIGEIQSVIVQSALPPADHHEAALRQALKAKEVSEKIQLANIALSSPDLAFRQIAIERLYASGDDVLRQKAIIASFEDHRGKGGMPVLVVQDENNSQSLSQRLIGQSFYVVSIDAATGSFQAQVMNTVANGVISRAGISAALLDVGTLTMTAEDEFRLAGEISTGTESIRLEMYLR